MRFFGSILRSSRPTTGWSCLLAVEHDRRVTRRARRGRHGPRLRLTSIDVVKEAASLGESFSPPNRRRPMTSSDAPIRHLVTSSSRFARGRRECHFSGRSGRAHPRAAGRRRMTLKNPAGIIAANTRLAWGSAGRFKLPPNAPSAVTLPVPSRSPVATNGSQIRPIRRIRRTSCWRNSILLFSQLVDELLDTAGVSGTREAKARFAAKFLVDALAPTNTLAGNPAASARRSTRAARASAEASRTWCTMFGTTVDGRRKSTAPDSRSASTWLPRRGAWSTAVTSSS